MGLRNRPRARLTPSTASLRLAAFRLVWLTYPLIFVGFLLASACWPCSVAFAAAQTDPAAKPPDRLLLNASSLTYNKDTEVVTAQGNVNLYYQGRTLQADSVRYDRAANRVFATGHARLTEADGTVSYGDRFDLTDDFKDGFIDALRADTSDHTHFSAARAERSDGEVTTFNKGLYTACQPCKDHPERAPLWQVRARKIIENGVTKTIYYEDAYLEFFGVPVAYVPYFSSPDASVTRKSGFLNPSYVYKNALGVGITAPYFWALAPNYDVTFSPTVLSRQGLLGSIEWRHRLENGIYSIRAAGIFQQDRTAFLSPPYGPGDRTFRGSVDTNGLFYINQKWNFGWNAELATDRYFGSDYRQRARDIFGNLQSSSNSTVFLTGQSARGYFDLRGYYFPAPSRYDLQKQQPIALPVLDYNKTIDIRPSQSGGIGGQIEIDANLTSLTRSLAAYQSTGAHVYDSAFGLYDVCTVYKPGLAAGNCLLRGIGGTTTRATLNVSWKRKYIDPIGEVWTPFAFAHLNGEWLSLNTTNSENFGASTISNASQPAFLHGANNGFNGEALPGIGLEYRYPFFATTSWATHVVEPIAQIIARPNQAAATPLVNEDAQSLVFDDSNLFEWSKYSGYDRFETGVRANLGAQYTMNFTHGGYANIMAGQSFQVAGTNSYATADAANVGIGSGLDKAASDYVTRIAFVPTDSLSLIAKGRFDSTSFAVNRLDVSANAKWGDVSGSLQYARYLAQPAIGYNHRREGLGATARYKFATNYFVKGNVVFDLSRYLDNGTLGVKVSRFAVASAGLGFGYEDDCTTFSVQYNSTYADPTSSSRTRNQTVLVELKLRTLGDTKLQQSLGTKQVNSGQ